MTAEGDPSGLKLGLIVDPEFYFLEKSVCALTPALIRALCRGFETRIIPDQDTYDRLCDRVDLLVSLEAKWAAPVLEWARSGPRRDRLPACPCFLMMSDPHIEQWRAPYVVSQGSGGAGRSGLDFVLSLYHGPMLRNLPGVPADRVLHFPWAVPGGWMDDRPLSYAGSRELVVFGASNSPAYELRNWCREQAGVRSCANSGVESKVMEDRDYFRWLGTLDAAIAAGSEDPKYRLTTPKYFEIAGAGALLFAQETDDLGRLGFVDGVNCVVFTRETFARRRDEYLADPGAERWLEIRRAGRELIRARHTIAARVGELARATRAWQRSRRAAA